MTRRDSPTLIPVLEAAWLTRCVSPQTPVPSLVALSYPPWLRATAMSGLRCLVDARQPGC